MIYRKWSLLTGPPAVLGGVVATVVIASLIFDKKGSSVESNSIKNSKYASTGK